MYIQVASFESLEQYLSYELKSALISLTYLFFFKKKRFQRSLGHRLLIFLFHPKIFCCTIIVEVNMLKFIPTETLHTGKWGGSTYEQIPPYNKMQL